MTTDPEPVPGSARLAARLTALWERAARAGRSLPGESALAEELSSSRPAVREALVRLEERGYIHRRKGADTAVNSSLLTVPARFDARLDEFDLIRAMGRNPSVEVLHHAVSRLDLHEAEEYDLPPATNAYRLTKLWRADGEPVLLAHDNVPVLQPDALDTVDTEWSMVDIATALTAERVEWELVWPSAENLSAEHAGFVDRPEGEATMRLDISGVSRRGTVCYWTVERHMADAFRYAMVRPAAWH